MMKDVIRFRLRASLVVQEISYPGVQIRVRTHTTRLASGGEYIHNPYLQVEASGTCNVTGEPMDWKGRKWLLSPHMTDGEIVQTTFKAIMTAEEHEIRERFKYRGQSIFDPHYDIEKLVEMRAGAGALKEREDTREVAV